MLGNGNHHLMLAGMEAYEDTIEISMEVPRDPETGLLYIHLGRSQNSSGSAHHRETCASMVMAVLFTTQETEPV